MTSFLILTGSLVWLIIIAFAVAKLIRRQLGLSVEPLDGKWIVVTGCDSGFGLGVVEQLSQRGASVIACTFTEEGSANAIKAGAKTAPVFDLTSETALREAAAKFIDLSGGKLWGMVHNAGIVLPGFAEYQPIGNYQKVMDVNFFSVVSLTQKLIPAIKAESGRIVLVSSVDGIVSLPGNAPYDASKYAIEAYADALRVELSFWDISVSVINPSTMRTPMAASFFADHRKAWNQMDEQDPDGEWKQAWTIEWLDEYVAGNQVRIEQIAQDPKHAIKDIVHAITSKRPEFRYLSGTLAKVLFFALWKMPERWSFVIKKATVNPPPKLD